MQCMLRPTLLNAALILLFCGSALGASVEEFFSSRQVVGVIPFAAGSSNLDMVAREKIDSLVNRLKGVDPEKQVVRLEGFSSPEGPEVANVDLSMKRALAVENYLRDFHHLPLNRYLVGRGTDNSVEMPATQRRRVEVVFYDNVLNMDDAHVDKIIIEGGGK